MRSEWLVCVFGFFVGVAGWSFTGIHPTEFTWSAMKPLVGVFMIVAGVGMMSNNSESR